MARHLQQAGHQITLGSRDIRKTPDWLFQAKVARMNWNDDTSLEEICSGVDVVIQAAGMNAQDCAADPVAALEFNGLATSRLLAASIRVGVKRFVYLSTAHVYASPLVGTITEDTCPRNLHPYATSHLAGENVVLSATQCRQIEGMVLRLSNAFGVPVHKDVNCWMLLVNDLCRQVVETGKIVLHSSGFQRRDFIPMAEICRIIEQLSTHDFDVTETGIFNVGSGASLSVLEIAQLVQQRSKVVLGFEPKLQRPAGAADEKYEILAYLPENLAKFGINISIYSDSEIDNLLAFCKTSYKQAWG